MLSVKHQPLEVRFFSLSALGHTPTSPRLEKAEQEKPRSTGIAHDYLGLPSCPWIEGGGSASADVLGSHSLWPAAAPQHTVNEDIVSMRLLRGPTPCSISNDMSWPQELLVSRPSPAQGSSSSACMEASRTLFCSTRGCWSRDLSSCVTCGATCAPRRAMKRRPTQT